MSAPVWENFVLKSGDGLSVPFILLWLGGDLTNLIGGAMANVLPTMIILAVYVSVSVNQEETKARATSCGCVKGR
jgi:hypothetical protein